MKMTDEERKMISVDFGRRLPRSAARARLGTWTPIRLEIQATYLHCAGRRA